MIIIIIIITRRVILDTKERASRARENINFHREPGVIITTAIISIYDGTTIFQKKKKYIFLRLPRPCSNRPPGRRVILRDNYCPAVLKPINYPRKKKKIIHLTAVEIQQGE